MEISKFVCLENKDFFLLVQSIFAVYATINFTTITLSRCLVLCAYIESILSKTLIADTVMHSVKKSVCYKELQNQDMQ